MFKKSERTGFLYWISHWMAFQSVALSAHAWHPRYLLHDWLKPWQKLFLGDYKKVKKYHRTHNNHHLEYSDTYGADRLDFDALCIDSECSKLTKSNAQLDAYQTMNWYIKNPDQPQRYKDILVGPDGDINKPDTWFIMGVLKKLDLYRPGPWDNYSFEELELLKRGEFYNRPLK